MSEYKMCWEWIRGRRWVRKVRKKKTGSRQWGFGNGLRGETEELGDISSFRSFIPSNDKCYPWKPKWNELWFHDTKHTFVFTSISNIILSPAEENYFERSGFLSVFHSAPQSAESLTPVTPEGELESSKLAERWGRTGAGWVISEMREWLQKLRA